MPIIPVLRRLRQEDQSSRSSLPARTFQNNIKVTEMLGLIPGRLHPGVRSDRIWLGRLVCRHLQQKAITGAARDTGPSSNYATISTPARGDKVSPIPPSLMETLEPAWAT